MADDARRVEDLPKVNMATAVQGIAAAEVKRQALAGCGTRLGELGRSLGAQTRVWRTK